jgi:hypothetical protein
MIVFMLFIWQQIYMLFRMTLRLTTYSSQLDLYRRLTTAPAPAAITLMDEHMMDGLTPATE